MNSDGGFYISAMSVRENGGIYRFRLEENGGLRKLSFCPVSETNWLAFSPDRRTLYSTSRKNGEGACAAFRVNPDNSLTLLNEEPSRGTSPCYVVASPDGKFLYCANYSSGSVTEYSLAADGSIAKFLRVIQHEGHGPNQKRQEGPHTHFTNLTPDGKFLIVIDLGIDAVKLYPLTSSGLDAEHVRTFRTPPGSGPRHLVFNAAGTLAYLVTELGNTVMVLRYSEGAFETLQTVSTLPDGGVDCATKAAAVRLSPDGRFLFASNRGYDSVACFRVDGETGFLVRYDILSSLGSSPRDIAFLPGGRAFAAANEFSDEVVFFDFDGKTGILKPNGLKISLPRPLALYF